MSAVPALAVVLALLGGTVYPDPAASPIAENKWAGAATQPRLKLDDQLRLMLTRYGVTTVVDPASLLPNTQALRARIEAGELDGPRIVTAGLALYPPEGFLR